MVKVAKLVHNSLSVRGLSLGVMPHEMVLQGFNQDLSSLSFQTGKNDCKDVQFWLSGGI